MAEFSDFEEEASQWQWNRGVGTDLALLELFQKDLARVEALLHEKVNISKWAAKFLRDITVQSSITLTSQVHNKLKGWSKFVLEGEAIPVGGQSVCPDTDDQSLSPAILWGPCPQDYNKWTPPKEDNLLPKETLSVSKSVAPFMRSCIKYIYSPLQPTRLTDASPVTNYIIDTPLIIDDSTKEEDDMNLIESLHLMELEKTLDSQYMEEALTSGEMSLSSEPPLSTSLPGMSPFPLPHQHIIIIEEIQESPITKPILTYGSWKMAPPMVDYAKVRNLEERLMDENINRGSEYCLDSPFMSDEPTFKEHRTPFDYTIGRLPNMVKFEMTSTQEFIKEIQSYREGDLLDEMISIEGHDVEEPHILTTQLPKIISIELYHIGEISACSNETESLSLNRVEEPSLTTRTANISVPSLTYMQDTAIQVNETPKTTLDISNTTNTGEEVDNSSVAATRMQTQIDVVVREDHEYRSGKRSIDEELENLISTKRKKAQKSDSYVRQPILELLKGGIPNITTTDTTLLGGDNTTAFIPQNPHQIQSFEHPKLDCTHTIGFNSAHIRKFQKHISHLSNVSDLNVVELDMDPDEVEFLLSAQCGVMVVDLSLLDQCIPGGDLVIQEKLIHNLKKFNHLIVLILTSYITKRETTAAFQLTASLLGAEAIIIHKGVENVCYWICELSQIYGDDWSPEKLEILDREELGFLIDCGLDPFSSVEVLHSMPLIQFVALSDKQRSQLEFLTPFQCESINSIFNQEWHMEPDTRNVSCGF